MKIPMGIIAAVVVMVLDIGYVTDTHAGSPLKQEAEIDSQLDLLDRPWKINLIRIATRDYLRHQARSHTGDRPNENQLKADLSSLAGRTQNQIETPIPNNQPSPPLLDKPKVSISQPSKLPITVIPFEGGVKVVLPCRRDCP